MKSSKLSIVGIVFSFILSVVVTFFVTSDAYGKTKTPIESFSVYLKGEKIGLIKSDKELYEYINKMQDKVKEEYGVEEVYIPNDINVVKDISYEENLTSIEKIYEVINEKSPFTIKAYIAIIDETNSTKYIDDSVVDDSTDISEQDKDDLEQDKIITKINVINKEIFKNAVKKVLLSFVTEEEFNNYENKTQSAIIGTGENIENLYIDANFSFIESYIPVNEKIYTNENDLTEYLLFGEKQKLSEYIVKSGETLLEVANENKMNVNELLIANSNLGSSSALLYEGQKLIVGVLDPVFQTVKEIHKIEDQTINFKTEYIYDNTQYVGYQRVQTKGISGVTRITQKIKTINGVIVNALISNKEEIKPVVNEVIVKGGRQAAIISAGNWGWPTNIPYIISSHYGWRWGRLHSGVDISGTGYGSPIYAAKPGIVVDIGYNGLSGNFVQIDHQNGYYSRYAHLITISPYVKVGDKVNMGQTIGDMGCSGNCYGTHLHFEIWHGKPYNGGQSINPLLFY